MNCSGKKIIAGAVLATGIMLSGISASAAVLIEWQDGSAENPFAGWSSEQYGNDNAAYFDLSNPNQNGTASLDLNPGTAGDPTVYRDVHYTTAGSLTGHLVSNYGSPGDNPYLQMNFYYDSSAGAQNGLGFYFAGTSGREWYYNIDSSYVSAGWNTLRVQLDYYADPYPSGGSLWYREDGGGNLNDFKTDIDAVSRVGMWIAYNENTATQGHAIGLYGISVPEPETYLILGMALLSVAIVFRKRISESLAEARAMMQV